MAATNIKLRSQRSLLFIFLVTSFELIFCLCKVPLESTQNFKLHELVFFPLPGQGDSWIEAPPRGGRESRRRWATNNGSRTKSLEYHTTTRLCFCQTTLRVDVANGKSYETSSRLRHCNLLGHTFRTKTRHWNRQIQRLCASNSSTSKTELEPASSRYELEQSTSHHSYDLTIIIPAYNEIDRIGYTLSTYVRNLQKMPIHHTSSITGSNNCTISGSVAILVVDDGSTDGTAEFVQGKSWLEARKARHDENGIFKVDQNYWQVDENVKCVSLPQNEGKGAAIERGVIEVARMKTYDANKFDCQTPLVLVADADGSGDISCLNIMIQELEDLIAHSGGKDTKKPMSIQQQALVVGYRENITSKSALRALLSWGFRIAVSSIFIGADLGTRDTQCGMKLMTLSASTLLYKQLHLKRWTHDVEVIHRAKILGMPVGECAVKWEDKEGSKLVESMGGAARVSVIMLSEIARMRIEYALGRWSVMK